MDVTEYFAEIHDFTNLFKLNQIPNLKNVRISYMYYKRKKVNVCIVRH